jgi:hypothetical protein
MAARAGLGDASEVPVFIVGMPRSGTTLVEQILASHGAVFGAGELTDVGAIAQALYRHTPGEPAYPACMSGLDGTAYAGFGASYVKRTRGLAPDAGRIVDKNPLNFLHLGLIALMLPEARIVHCRRNPADVAVSCYFQNFTRGQEWAFDLGDIGRFHRAYERLMEHWRGVLASPMLELDYEAMVGDSEAESRRLVAFCGLEWDPACLAFHRARRPVRTASQWQVRQPIYAHSVER